MSKKTIILASDHAGFPLKNTLKVHLEAAGYATVDAGTDSTASCDYPVYAEAGCRKLLEGEDFQRRQVARAGPELRRAGSHHQVMRKEPPR